MALKMVFENTNSILVSTSSITALIKKNFVLFQNFNPSFIKSISCSALTTICTIHTEKNPTDLSYFICVTIDYYCL